MEIRLNALAQLISRCWTEAETQTAQLIVQKHPGAGEELVTEVFAGELRSTVAKASGRGLVGEAFVNDLRTAVPQLEWKVERSLARLVAIVNFHNRAHEGKRSASDLGLVVARPIVRLEPGRASLKFDPTHATGLLAQAKLGTCEKVNSDTWKWGSLSGKQPLLIPERLPYYSLLLYRLRGRPASDLLPFQWQLCKGHTVDEIKKWLRSGSFPQEVPSPDIIGRIFARSIGTDDSEVIEKIINPASSRLSAIELRISWPDDAPPPGKVMLSKVVPDRDKVRLLNR